MNIFQNGYGLCLKICLLILFFVTMIGLFTLSGDLSYASARRSILADLKNLREDLEKEIASVAEAVSSSNARAEPLIATQREMPAPKITVIKGFPMNYRSPFPLSEPLRYENEPTLMGRAMPNPVRIPSRPMEEEEDNNNNNNEGFPVHPDALRILETIQSTLDRIDSLKAQTPYVEPWSPSGRFYSTDEDLIMNESSDVRVFDDNRVDNLPSSQQEPSYFYEDDNEPAREVESPSTIYGHIYRPPIQDNPSVYYSPEPFSPPRYTEERKQDLHLDELSAPMIEEETSEDQQTPYEPEYRHGLNPFSKKEEDYVTLYRENIHDAINESPVVSSYYVSKKALEPSPTNDGFIKKYYFKELQPLSGTYRDILQPQRR